MELLDVVDDLGEPTGETVDRERAHREGIRHRTAHVWILRMKNGRMEILLQKRSRNKAEHPGCYDISSAGHIPAGTDYIESAVRELKEELGLTVRSEELIFCGDRKVVWDDCFFGRDFHDRQYSRVFFMWKDAEEKDLTLQKEEVDSVLWMDLDACMLAVKENAIPHCIVLYELEMVKNAAEKDLYNRQGRTN